jgi:hypothetical protein
VSNRTQTNALGRSYRIVDGYTPSTPTQTAIANAFTAATNWYNNAPGDNVTLSPASSAPFTINAVPNPHNGDLARTGGWDRVEVTAADGAGRTQMYMWICSLTTLPTIQ